MTTFILVFITAAVFYFLGYQDCKKGNLDDEKIVNDMIELKKEIQAGLK